MKSMYSFDYYPNCSAHGVHAQAMYHGIERHKMFEIIICICFGVSHSKAKRMYHSMICEYARLMKGDNHDN